jgi:uncharacterized C2H2 Zn-finger protein
MTPNGFRVHSLLVALPKGGDLARCPKCGLLPVEVTFTSPLDVTHHRFECPQCDNPRARWEWSHAGAAQAWNEYART